MDIEFEEQDARGRWTIDVEGAERAAEMSFTREGDTIRIDHTFVPETARGQGLAQKLAARAVADAREKGWKIVPVCAFMVAEAKRHDDWDDVLAR